MLSRAFAQIIALLIWLAGASILMETMSDPSVAFGIDLLVLAVVVAVIVANWRD